MLPTVFLVSLIVFFLIRLIPDDIIDMMLEHTSVYVVSKSGTVQAIELMDTQRPLPCSLASLL